uniref:Uncharacterized protein n=1 Tax=Arundo donax TaxID=35708 RepID=A0A0A9ASR0_ARUDO
MVVPKVETINYKSRARTVQFVNGNDILMCNCVCFI